MMKKYWKRIVILGLVCGAGYVLFCLAYDAYEEYRHTLPERRRQASLTRLDNDIDAFVKRANAQAPSGAEMIFWEYQSWETGGGRNRLTLWADGRSEARVYPCYHNTEKVVLRPEAGWEKREEGDSIYFIRSPVYSKPDAQEKFHNALKLGVHLLQPVKRNFVDGGGVLIGIQTGGVLKQQVFPEFGPEHRQTKGFIRFKALSRLLGEFAVEPKAFRTLPKE